MSGQQQQNIFTIQETQLNGGNGLAGNMNGNSNSNNNNNMNGNNDMQQMRRESQSDILIDTSSIPLTQQAPLPPMQHHQHSLQPTSVNHQHQQQQQEQEFDPNAITSQPIQSSGSSKVAPENQSVVYSVHPVFSLLDQHDALLVRQRADCTSTCCGFESVNTYTVRSKDGQPILKAIENSNCCERCCFETNREFNLSLVHGDEVVARIKKDHRLARFCCYSNAIRIESPEDNPIGLIKQQFTLFGHSKYAIFDCQQPPKKAAFLLESSSCRFCFTPLLCTCLCANSQFRVLSTETGERVATISRHWSQAAEGDDCAFQQQQQRPASGSAGSQLFGVQFETNQLEARQKVLLLSACFMLDFFYFENDRRRRKLASC